MESFFSPNFPDIFFARFFNLLANFPDFFFSRWVKFNEVVFFCFWRISRIVTQTPPFIDTFLQWLFPNFGKYGKQKRPPIRMSRRDLVSSPLGDFRGKKTTKNTPILRSKDKKNNYKKSVTIATLLATWRAWRSWVVHAGLTQLTLELPQKLP